MSRTGPEVPISPSVATSCSLVSILRPQSLLMAPFWVTEDLTGGQD